MEANEDAATAPHVVHVCARCRGGGKRPAAIQVARELELPDWLVRAAMADALGLARELATAIAVTGGVRVIEDNGARVLAPVAAPDWHDLGTLYLAACLASGAVPRIE